MAQIHSRQRQHLRTRQSSCILYLSVSQVHGAAVLILLTPDVNVFSNNRFTSVDVDELYINVEGNSSLIFDNVFSYTLAGNICIIMRQI